jgi:hypothetical protein
MVRKGLAGATSILVVILSCQLGDCQSQEIVYHRLGSDKVEAVLKELAITYQKAPGKKDGIFSYDFERNGTKVRLYNYGGDDLWIEADFTDATTLAEVNRWNMRAKLSRAVLVKEGDGATVSLEAQIDCALGITLGMTRNFIQRFDGEIQAFTKFIQK